MVDSYLSTKSGVIHLMISEGARFTDGRTTDAQATALALPTQSGRAQYVGC